MVIGSLPSRLAQRLWRSGYNQLPADKEVVQLFSSWFETVGRSGYAAGVVSGSQCCLSHHVTSPLGEVAASAAGEGLYRLS